MGGTTIPLPKDATTNTNEATLPADATSAPTTPVYSHGASGSWEEAPWYDRALPPNIANAYVKAKNFLNKPLLSHIPEMELPVAAAKTASQYLKSRGYTKAPKILDAYTGTMEGISDTAQAMSTPINLGMMFSLGRLKTLGVAGTALDRLISAGFSAQMLHQAYAQLPDVKKAIDSGDWEAAARAITSETGTAVLGGLAAHGAVENTAIEPKQAEFQKTENPSSVKPMTREEITRAVSQLSPETTEEAKARRYQSAQIRHIQKISASTPKENPSIEFTKDSNGITWATDKSVSPNPVSIPDNIPANEREAYAADKLKQQGEMAAAIKKRLLAIPGTIEVKSQATTAPVTESYHPDLQKVVDKYGETENASGIKNGASFITPNGKFVHLGSDLHPAVIEKATGERTTEDKAALGEHINKENKPQDSRVRFLNDTGAIRIRFSRDMAGDTVHISVPAQGVTEAQIPALRQAIAQAGRYGNVVMERADVNPENVSTASMTKEFPRPSETEDYLRQIQAHPEQNVGNSKIIEGINRYQTAHGNPPIQSTKNIPLNQDLSKKTADYFEKTPHNPNNPEVQKSYNSLKTDISDQWNHATKDMGIKFEPWTKEGQPYKNSAEMMKDVRNNHHLYFYQGGDLPRNHPLLDINPQTGLSYNDMFRAVHDLFGHAAEGNEFGPKGERRAFIAHSQMMRPDSIPALAFETHGQNSWVNFGAHLRDKNGNIPERGEKGFIPQSERPFAEQKANVMPAELHQSVFENTAERMKTENAGAINPVTGKTDTTGIGTEIYPEAKVRLSHKPTSQDIQDFYTKNKSIFDKHPELRLGWDKDPAKGWELNIGAAGPNAVEVAKKLDQRAAFDIDKGKEILTGGKNKQKSFPDYSLEQRLADLKGEVSKTSHATLAPIPLSLKGDNPAITDESIHAHEYGHGAHAVVNGARLAELRSYMHPESIGNAVAAAVTRWPSGGAKTYDEWIAKDPNNALNTIQNSLAGPLTQEVVYGIPMNENPGIAGDMRDIRQALDTLGLTLAQQEDVMDYLIKGWKDKLTAKNPLTGRTLGDIIKQYAPRDEDIRAELLASPKKIDKFAEEVRQHENEVRQHENRQREGNNRGNVTGVSEGTEQIGRENVARTEGLSANSNISKSLRAIPGAIQVTAKYTPKGSAVPLLEKPLPTEAGAQRTFVPEKIHQGVSIKNPVVADFQRTMGDWMKKTAGSIKEPDANLKRSINLAHNEINHWIMENGGEGKGWYRRKTDAAIKVLSKAHPQLKDPAHATIFKALWTAHSYGNDPDINMAEAEQNLSNLEDKGKIEYNKGTKTNGETLHWSGHSGNAYTLAKTQHLIDKYGEDGAAKWLTTKHPWSEIQDEFKDANLNVSKKSITLDKDGKAYGAMAFGPKGGAFFLNLNGINDHTTVDVWGARALRRWEGRIGSPDTLKKDHDSGLTIDRPPDAGEISRFHKVIQSVAKKLNLDTDDVQALQWYFEHKLYEVHGVGEKARDYEEAAKNVINKKGTGEPINALDLLRALGKWKSSIQSRGNEGAGIATPKAGQNAISRNLFENH